MALGGHDAIIAFETERIIGARFINVNEVLSWEAEVQGRIGSAALTLKSLDPPVYVATFEALASPDRWRVEYYVYGLQGFLLSAVTLTTDIEASTKSILDQIYEIRETDEAEPDEQARFRLRSILSQGPDGPTGQTD